MFCVTRERPGGPGPILCYQIRQLDFGHVATGTSRARPACPSPPIRPLQSGAGRNLAPKTTKVVIVGWWRVTINDMAHSTGLSAVAARACARWREVVKAGRDSRRSPAIAAAPSSSTIGMAKNGTSRDQICIRKAGCRRRPTQNRQAMETERRRPNPLVGFSPNSFRQRDA